MLTIKLEESECFSAWVMGNCTRLEKASADIKCKSVCVCVCVWLAKASSNIKCKRVCVCVSVCVSVCVGYKITK